MQRRAASAFCRTKNAVFSRALPKSIAFFEKLWYNTDKFFENAATAENAVLRWDKLLWKGERKYHEGE